MQSKTQNENPARATKKSIACSLVNCLTNLTPEHCLPEFKYGGFLYVGRSQKVRKLKIRLFFTKVV
jgi:hypothetical protein